MGKVTFDQINLVCGDVEAAIAFYRRLGVEIPETSVWRTPTGAHHVGTAPSSGEAAGIDLDSTAFAQHWNSGWKGRSDLSGRVVVGFSVPTRQDVDDIFRNMTSP